MTDLLSILLHSRTQAHIYHLRVSPNGLALHKALQEYYESIVEHIDEIAEAYQGMIGLIKFKSVTNIDNNSDRDNIIEYFNNLLKFVQFERKKEELSASWIQNEIDNIEKLIYQTVYKLKNL
jgi:DNA-binding ferritin-like protein